MCHFKIFACSAFICCNISFVPTIYIIMRLNFFQSSVLWYFTLVYKYVMDVWMSSLFLLVRNRPLAEVVWKYCLLWSFILSALLLVFNRNYFVGVAALVEKYSGHYFIVFLCSWSCQSWPLLYLYIPRSYQNNHGFFLWRLLFSRSHLGKFSLMNSIVTGTSCGIFWDIFMSLTCQNTVILCPLIILLGTNIS